MSSTSFGVQIKISLFSPKPHYPRELSPHVIKSPSLVNKHVWRSPKSI